MERSTPPTGRTRVRRLTKRGAYDRPTIDAILDEALVAHLAFTGEDGQPYAIPTLHARVGDEVCVHGSAASRTLRTLGAGARACLTVRQIDRADLDTRPIWITTRRRERPFGSS